MNAKRRRVSHVVRVARIRVETAVVEIEGDDRDDEEAARQAIEKAELLPDDVWVMQPFDESAYRPHVQSMISREEIAELTQEGRSADAELADLGEAIYYQLLKANCDTGEGELALQPWLAVDEPDLLSSDLCRGWIDALQELGLNPSVRPPRRPDGGQSTDAFRSRSVQRETALPAQGVGSGEGALRMRAHATSEVPPATERRCPIGLVHSVPYCPGAVGACARTM